MESPIDRELVMESYDALPDDLRTWIQNLWFSLADEHIIKGAKEVRRVKAYVEAGGQIYFNGNGLN